MFALNPDVATSDSLRNSVDCVGARQEEANVDPQRERAPDAADEQGSDCCRRCYLYSLLPKPKEPLHLHSQKASIAGLRPT